MDRSVIKVDNVQQPSLAKHDSKNLDLVFAMDCTGSMGSYINEAKNNICKIVEEIVATEKSDVRLALVEYRDHPPQDHTFVTRCHDFTASPRTMKDWLASCSAQGGGDEAEAVADALHDVLKLSWRDKATKICVCISDAPRHGLGSSSDGFPQGCPNGIDPIEVAHKFAQKGITLYVAGCEPSISMYKDFFLAIAYITGGQYVPMRKAKVLAKVIIGGAQEELSLNRLMEEVDAEIQTRANAGEEIDEEMVSGLLHERWTQRGECATTLLMNKSELLSASASQQAKSFSKMKCLSAVRKDFIGNTSVDGGNRLSTFYSSAKTRDRNSSWSSWMWGMFSGLGEKLSGWGSKPKIIPDSVDADRVVSDDCMAESQVVGGSGEDEYETVKSGVSVTQASRLVKKSMAKHGK